MLVFAMWPAIAQKQRSVNSLIFLIESVIW